MASLARAIQESCPTLIRARVTVLCRAPGQVGCAQVLHQSWIASFELALVCTVALTDAAMSETNLVFMRTDARAHGKL
jgi:hypothetical protein